MVNRVKDLLNSRAMPLEALGDLPKLGVITVIGEATIAAAFLRKIEGNGTALLDSLITDPRFTAQERDEAIEITIKKLLRLAKHHGITKIIATSTDKHTLMRSKRFGFVELPHQVITLSLS